MSGDINIQDDERIIFYTQKMTAAKIILLKHKGIHLNYSEETTSVSSRMK